MVYSLFIGLELFLKSSLSRPYQLVSFSSEFYAVKRRFVLEKLLVVSISIFAPLIMADETDVSNGGCKQ